MVDYVNVFGLFHATRKQLYVSAAVFTAVIILIIGLSVGLSGKDQPSHHEEIGFNGRDALDHAPLVDGHNDLPWKLYVLLNNHLSAFNFDQDLSEDSVWGKSYCSSCHTDLSRLIKGKVGAQFWVAYTSCSSQYKDSIQLTLRQIDVIKRLINKYSSNLELVTNSFDIENVWKSGKIASMIAVEGGHSIDSSLAVLRLYYELGVRYLTLTHSCNTPWADGSPIGNSSLNDLTAFGVKVIHEMNRLGMLVDLSHVSHNVMRHVLAVTKAPVIFSHSSAFAICNNYRNVPDDVLQLVKKNNGIVMVNFYSGFVNCNPSRNATMRDVVDHINYIRNLIGVDHVGIGADYDGVDKMPEGLDDVSKYPNLFDRLHTNVDNEPYWSQEDLEKLAGRNLIRVFSAVEAVRDSLSSESPYEDIIDSQELYNAQLSENLTPGECQTAIEWNSIMTTTTEATSTIGSNTTDSSTIGSSTTDSSTIGSSTVKPSVSSSTTLSTDSKPEQ